MKQSVRKTGSKPNGRRRHRPAAPSSRKGRRPQAAPSRRPPGLPGTAEPERVPAESLLTGRHPVLEALRAGRTMTKVWVYEDAAAGSLREIVALARAQGVPVSVVPKARLEQLANGPGHQGVVAQVAAKDMIDLHGLIALVEQAEDPLVFFLDGIQDPQNLGAILRVADATGATAVVLPERGAVGLTDAVAKASAGAVEYVPVARVTNLAQAVERLQRLGMFVYAAHPDAETLYTAVDWTGAIGVVIGAEGTGVRPIVRQRADGLVKLPMLGHVSSLNASNAAAVIGFEVIRQRGQKKSVLTRV
ncbi:MAG: 23S rRNA (guanosine(2251)-2'-O)-methyltransferase RlmB [Firmicutes bacterium]|nr:23S rRNA (guanosine(2251)-2'-O)-methyltransferase RlmB [Bacillota bacterium]